MCRVMSKHVATVTLPVKEVQRPELEPVQSGATLARLHWRPAYQRGLSLQHHIL